MGKIREFFRRLFNRNKVLTLPDESNNKNFEKPNIKDELKVSTNFELLKMQEEYEKGNINEKSISNGNLKELIKLFENQIKELDYKIASKSKL